MTGAMYSAIAGLKSHMNKLNVIGNNVSNVNTYGYKSSRVTFKESLYTSVSGGSNGTDTMGGTNPSQLGYGCSVGTIDLDMSTKNYTPTGIATDCMINGDGFFLVGAKNADITDAASASSLSLTRVGNFTFDASGYLVDGNGNVVYGFLAAAESADAASSPNLGLTDAEVDAGEVGISTKLTAIRLPMAAAASTDADAPAEGSALYPAVDDTTGAMTDIDEANGASTSRIQLESVSISENGKITGINKSTGDVVVVGYIAIGSVDNPNGVTHTDGPYYKAMDGAGSLRICSIGNCVTGYLNNVEEGEDGATVANAISGTGETALVTGGLESSGTDLATEFSEMITTQRGYQANTRIITVTDSMLEELVNMKR